MQTSIFHRLSSVLWVLIVTLVVLLAIYVSVGRTAVSSLGNYQTEILDELNARVPFTLAAHKVSGEWHSFTPVIVLSGLSLSVEGSAEAPLELSQGRVGIDVFNSLRTRTLQMTRLALDDLTLRAELTEQGQLRIKGFDGGGEIGEWLRKFLLNIELVALRRNTLKLAMPGGESRDFDLSLRLERDGSYRRLEINLMSSTGGRIDMLGEGVGNPFTPELFNGDLYVDIGTDDVGAIQDILANRLPDFWADGSLDLELWLSWKKSEAGLLARAEATELVIKGEDDAWHLPLDRVALEAELISGRDRWTLYTSDLQIEKGAASVQLPRMQLDFWGQALRARAIDVQLEPANALATSIETLPPKLAGVFRELQPRGTLSALQVSVGDLRAAYSDWELEGRFRDLEVTSWHGAPGVTSGSGHVQLRPGGGTVLLDSQNLTMSFPGIFDQPLQYEDFNGALHIDWDRELLRLSSDLITARGVEGTAQVLFGLDIPLVKNDIGLEMYLLVGLQDTHPIHRVKYVPNTLSGPLREWLSGSIGEGNIEEGAFLWRGALRREAGQRRTVQLAFNISDTSVDYHPQWPPVTVHSGVVLIDDADVSVWANQADLYASRVGRLSAETWLDTQGQVMLAVDASMQGPAADGLLVLNKSPINELVKGTFLNWSLAGHLDTELQLQMNLSDSADPPRVEVDTRWQQVDLRIEPGGLSLSGLNGGFSYNSSHGFSSSGLQGYLWDKPLSAEVTQLGSAAGRGYDAARAITQVDISTRVDMADLRRWLALDSLAFASGESAARVRVQIPAGEAPLLLVDTDLQGVSLDVPSPWAKSAEQKQSFELQWPLGVVGEPMRMRLVPDLAMHLDVRDGGFYSAALGINEQPAELRKGVLEVSGDTDLVQGDEWVTFIGTYFAAGWDAATADASGGAVAGADEDAGDFVVDITDVHAQRLEIWGQTLTDVDFSLRVDGTQWLLQARTDWVQGEYLQVNGQPESVLALTRLDLEGLKNLSLEAVSDSATGEPELLELPDMDVSIQRLHREDLELGKLNFGLRSTGATLMANNITGEVAGLRLGEPQAGQLRWQQGIDSRTSLQLGLQFDDLGKTLGHFGYEKILETESGGFDLNLQWPGAPQSFTLRQGQGAIEVAIAQGRFLEAPSGASGALKVVNILNLADIVQRLSLSHMFESGIPFDAVTGEVFLHSGTVEVVGMEVKGPSSFQFNGIADVGARSLDGELVATLPVANNLPWVAALTASLPVAAGVFVVSKLLQKQVNRLSSAVYSVTGSWDDPEVEFEHIFESSSGRNAGAQAQSDSLRGTILEQDPNAPPIQEPVPDPQSVDSSLP